MKKLLFLCGSLRAASSSRATVRSLEASLKGKCVIEHADIASLPFYNADITDDPNVQRLIDQIDAADGLLFVTPEYNYSVPGLLKNAIDWASRPAYQSVFKSRKCFVISVSGGLLGGVRAQSHLKYILNGMLAEVFPWQEVAITQANAKVKDGVLADEAVIDFATQAVEAFIESL
ncbi:MAG: NAD(P)H-dependent oxidoreductase [Salaquimonas sp.]|jgi:chromate reductase|nr:NAD(P)H-dependent oxidoreductase [Salaquimonas sp.]